MSGGHFNNNGYIYYQVHQFADELEHSIENNWEPDEYGYCPKYSSEVIKYLKLKVNELRKMADTMKSIDYLYSGDYGEESFLKKVGGI